MKNIRSFDKFVNEEYGLKQTLAGAALGLGLSLSNPSLSQNIKQPTKIEQSQKLEQSIQGWGKAKFGMTVDEVKKVYPQSISDSTKYSNDKVGLLKIENYKIEQDTFNVSFVFKNGNLDFIKLSYKEMPTLESYDRLKLKLITKYGKEFTDKPLRRTSSSLSVSSHWTGSGYEISLSLFQSSYGVSVLNILYKKVEESEF
jgi:hypothetical protein